MADPDPDPDPDPDAAWPSLSVVMAVRQEREHLAASLGAVQAQAYPGTVDIAVAVGPSTDGTLALAHELAADDPRVVVVENPPGITPAGLNRAIAATSGEIVARVDGHAVIPPGYLRRAVEELRATGAVNVGGVMAAEGVTEFQRAVAAAMSSRFGTGDAKFHYGGDAGPADTVYLGVFRRDALLAAGAYDEHFVRAQDAELNHRLRTGGGEVWFTPDLQVAYRPRTSLDALARQYFLYGRWRRVIGRRHRGSLRWRQLVPPATIAASLAGTALGLAGRRIGWVLPGGYFGAVLAASVHVGRDLDPSVARWLPVVFPTMHGAWAAGFLTSPRSLASE